MYGQDRVIKWPGGSFVGRKFGLLSRQGRASRGAERVFQHLTHKRVAHSMLGHNTFAVSTRLARLSQLSTDSSDLTILGRVSGVTLTFELFAEYFHYCQFVVVVPHYLA